MDFRFLPFFLSLARLLRPTTTTERNWRNVLVDGIGVGIVVGVGTFLPVFLARLGAPDVMVGLITSLPALAGTIFAVPIGRLLERQRNIVPWYARARVLVLSSYAVFGLLPFILPQSLVPATIIALWALATLPSTVVNVAFTLVMSGVAGPRRRFDLMSMRWSTLGFATAVTVALAGQFLERIVFPLNYQLIFIASFLAGMMSFLFSSGIELPDNPPVVEEQQRVSMLRRLQEGWRGMLATPAFARFVGSAFVFRCGVAMAMPLFPLYWVRVVQANDAWIGIINTANSGILLIAFYLWSGWARKHGIGTVLLISSFGIALYPLLTAATGSVVLLAVFAGMAGFFAAGNDLVNFDLVLSTCPAERQAIYIAFYQTLQNLALFLMPLLGTTLAGLVGLPVALIVAGGLRLLGALLFLLLGVGKAEAGAAAT